MNPKTLDERFDAGLDVMAELDLTTVKRPNLELQRVGVDFPTWMVASLDREATRLGVSRGSIIKMWLAERFDRVREAGH